MNRLFLISLASALILVGCQASGLDAPPPPAVSAGLPDTWTPAPSPSTAPTEIPSSSPIGSVTPSPTPTELVPSPSLAAPTGTPSSATPFPRATPQPLVPGKELTITQIQMFTPERGWGVGVQQDPISRILVTADGGRTWQDRTPPVELYDPDFLGEEDSAVYFWDQDRAWALYNHDLAWDGYGIHTVWRTVDGGRTWTPSDPLPFALETRYVAPAQFYFINPRQGWLWVHGEYMMSHDYGSLFYTGDGGKSWTLVNRPGDSMIEALWNTELAFADQSHGWMLKDSLGGFYPFIEITSDGGWTWERIELPAPEGTWDDADRRCIGSDAHFASATVGTFLLNCALERESGGYDLEAMTSYLYSSGDGGRTWAVQELPAQIDQLVFLEGGLGYALGKQHFRTRDGGVSWDKVKAVNWRGEFSVLSEDTLWAVARNGEEIALVFSEDGGKSYQLITPVVE